MSKVVTIPTSMSPFVVTINGVPQSYPAGATMEVPDNVAAIIEQYEKGNFPQPALPATEINMVSPGGCVFKVAVGDDGELVTTGELFNFNIGKKTYTARRGMTWAKWIRSEYAPVRACVHCGSEHPEIDYGGGGVGYYDGCPDAEYELIENLYAFETEEDLEDWNGVAVGADELIDPNKIYN